MSTTSLHSKIDKKYTELQKVYQSDDDNLNLLIRLLASELVIISDCQDCIATSGCTLVTGAMTRINPSVTIRQGSIASASRIIRQIHQMTADTDDAVPTNLADFLK